MRDMISCEEVFGLDAAHGEDADEGDDEVCWCKFFESCPSCFGKK